MTRQAFSDLFPKNSVDVPPDYIASTASSDRPLHARRSNGTMEVDRATITPSVASAFEISTTLLNDPAFVPGRTMLILAKGVRLMSFPASDRETKIEICGELRLRFD